MDPNRRIDEYASRQYGVVSLGQCQNAGITHSMINRRLEIGAWVRLASGVYALASAPPRWERQVAAAVLSRPAACVAGSSAAALLGFEGFRKTRVEIMVPDVANARSSLARVIRNKWFDEVGRTRAHGFEVTNEAETVLVLAGRLPVNRLERIIDERLATGSMVVEDYEPIRRRISGARVRGSRPLLNLLDERSQRGWQPPDPELERYLDRLVDHPEVPPSTRQHPFRLGDRSAVVDRYIGRWRLILEADGRRWHTRREDFESDRARDNAAAAQGLAVLRFIWRMLTEQFDDCRRTLLDTGRARPGIA